jgi:hypothetical protein
MIRFQSGADLSQPEPFELFPKLLLGLLPLAHLSELKGKPPMALEDYPFRVEELSPASELVRIMAYLDHPIIARAAFRATVQQYPKARIRLRYRALVMEEHKPK